MLFHVCVLPEASYRLVAAQEIEPSSSDDAFAV